MATNQAVQAAAGVAALHTFANVTDGLMAQVFSHAKGFAVVLSDLDAGEAVPSVAIFPTESRAVGYARNLASVGDYS